jgi:serine/threonine protein kinase
MTHIGHYELQNELGAGGMGVVYRGRDTRTQQTVAIKQLRADVAQPENIERFKREGEALRDLNHPNIVKMLDTFEHEGQHYLVMEYVSGGDLSTLLAQENMPLEQILKLSIDLADALTRAHKLNIIHRDLKPANVLIGDDGVLRLTDFGVAHVGSKERVTETDAIIGTIDYLPPEAFSGQLFDERGDIWAFGVMLFEMLAGERPFRGDTLFEIIQAISTQAIPDLETLRPDVPTALVDLVYRMLEHDPQMRMPSVRIVGAELESALKGRNHTPQTPRFALEVADFLVRPKHNLPAQTMPFVGREHELIELGKLLKDSSIRLITILAQGGMGKTRLCLELAQHALDQDLYTDGVYFIELAPLSDADNIPNSIADAAGYQFLGDGTPKEQLLTILRERNLLLVMDNYEHLPDGFAVVGDILKSAPNVHIIATSRQRLSQTGETLFHLSGMDFPDWETPDDALEYAAVKLFMNSAKRIRPDFELLADNLDVVARICKLVQGMPLGIVLAASWLSVLSLAEIADEMQGSLDFLETDETDLPERQRSIRAVMDYSWEQMTDSEQQVFMKLSVFRGGFTREAAQVVAGANLRILMSLVNKSLIRRDADSGRYEIHELLRQYADEKLEIAAETERIHDAHKNYYADFMQEHAIDIKGRRQLEGLNEVESDFENVLVAWERAIEQVDHNALDHMVEALMLFCKMRTRYQQAEDLFQTAVETLGETTHPVRNRLHVHWVQAWALAEQDVPEEIRNQLGNFKMIAQQQGDHKTFVMCLWLEGEFDRITTGAGKTSNRHLEKVLLHYRDLEDEYYVARVLQSMAFNYLEFIRYDENIFVATNEEYLNLSRAIGDQDGVAHAIYYAAVHAGFFGRYSESASFFHEAYVIWKEIGDLKSVAVSMIPQVFMNLMQGHFEDALMQAEYLIRIGSDINFAWILGQGLTVKGFITTLQGDYENGQRLGQQVLSASRDSLFFNHTAWRTFVIADIGLNNNQQARSNIQVALKDLIKKTNPRETLQWLPIVALLLSEDDKNSLAVELLGLTFHHPESITGWMGKWDLLTRLQVDLRQELGEEAYQAAWERGKSLDLETVVQGLLDVFRDNQ